MTDQALLPGIVRPDTVQEVSDAIRRLPALPTIIRYLDEYDDTMKSVRTADAEWHVRYDTLSLNISFRRIRSPELIFFCKHFFSFALSHAACATVEYIYGGFKEWFIDDAVLYEIASQHPSSFSDYWNRRVLSLNLPQRGATFVKWMMYFMCEMAIGQSNTTHTPFVKSLPFDWNDNYTGIASGEDVLAVAKELEIINHLDTVRHAVVSNAGVSDELLTKACLLCICYQHGLRPVQICRVEVDDLRFYESGHGDTVAHLLAYRAKKRDSKEKTPFISKIKSDWTSLFTEYHRRRRLGPVWQQCDGSGGKLFTLSKAAIIKAIGDIVEEVTGERRTATILRHSAAQRMVDGGASVEEVAEFLGHSDLDTCLAYFEASPAQAELVNKAMAASPIYSKIADIIAAGTIDKAALLGLPDDQQIGGLPHGIPIAGIGACRLGQSLCAKNPVLSCYDCRKFIPVSDADLHRQVLRDLRGVVKFFFDEARGGIQSRAYRELAGTLEAIQAVIRDVEALRKAPK